MHATCCCNRSCCSDENTASSSIAQLLDSHMFQWACAVLSWLAT
jgi:hypothetical protein